MGILFVTHNRRKRDNQTILFYKYGTGNYRSVSCKTSLGVMMGLAKKLVYKSHQNLNIESTFDSERIMIISNGINHWKTLLRPHFSEELKMAI